MSDLLKRWKAATPLHWEAYVGGQKIERLGIILTPEAQAEIVAFIEANSDAAHNAGIEAAAKTVRKAWDEWVASPSPQESAPRYIATEIRALLRPSSAGEEK